jgi:hypothetical protein
MRIAIRADFQVRANRLVIYEIPTLPTWPLVRRRFRRPVFLFVHQVPFPGTLLLGQSFPRLVPKFMWAKIVDGKTP